MEPAGSGPPAKPWERAGNSSSGPAPFKPPSGGNTSDVVEASGTAKPGEIVSAGGRSAAVDRNAVGRPMPARPWERNTYGGGYGTGMNCNSGLFGGGMGSYGGGGLYWNSMYRGDYGGFSGGGMYGGGGMFNRGLGGPMGGYGMGMGPYGGQDPNNPNGAPSSPPGFWISFLRVVQGAVNFFGRISILMDQNTQAFHMFMTALLQLLDRGGVLYGELARFVLRLLGIKTKPRKVQGPLPNGPPAPHNPQGSQNNVERPKAAPSGAWDNVWGNGSSS